MNSVHLSVVDATGASYLDTFTANTAENIAAFRKHVAACRHYWKTREYRAKVPALRWPCEPLEVRIEPYHDRSAS
jgi:hypothetical protein